MMRIIKFAIAAAVASTMLSGMAVADDFVAQCTTIDKSPEHTKVCECVSGKLTGADRTAALDAMKAMNTALATGKAEDAATATQKNAKGLEIMMTAEMNCM